MSYEPLSGAVAPIPVYGGPQASTPPVRSGHIAPTRVLGDDGTNYRTGRHAQLKFREVEQDYRAIGGNAAVSFHNKPKAERNFFLIISGSGVVAVGLFILALGIGARFQPSRHLPISYFKPLLIAGGGLMFVGGGLILSGCLLPDEESDRRREELQRID